MAALRDLLIRDSGTATTDVELRSVPAIPAAVITETVDAQDAAAWLQGALGELHATVAAQELALTGPAGGIYADEVFTHHRGQASVVLPCEGGLQPMGQVARGRIPAAELAVMTHIGPPSEADRTYAALAAYVARHALAVDGPMREYYLVGRRETADGDRWRTEIGWPVFLTGGGDGGPVRDLGAG